VLSVVIPTHNRAALLRRSLGAIAHQSIGPRDLDVIVVDDGSTDETAEVLSSRWPFALRHIRVDHIGYRTGELRNVGAAQTTGERLCFLDDDVVVNPRWAEALVADPSDVVIGALLGYTVDPPSAEEEDVVTGACVDLAAGIRVDPSILAHDPREYARRVFGALAHQCHPWTLTWSGNLAVRRRLFDRIGGFDQNFRGYGLEDVELGYRLWKSRASFGFGDAAWAVHHATGVFELRYPSELNARRFLAKSPVLPVELLQFTNPARWANAWSHISALFGLPLVPDYAAEGGSLREISRPAGPGTLLVGCGLNGALLEAERALEFDPTVCRLLSAACPGLRPLWLLGAATPFPAATFRNAVVSDFWRALPIPYVRLMLRELLRVAHAVTVVALAGRPRLPPFCQWSNASDIRAVVDGLTVDERARVTIRLGPNA
jgi:glycosyltransferase involved in cell wall biosynthesis